MFSLMCVFWLPSEQSQEPRQPWETVRRGGDADPPCVHEEAAVHSPDRRRASRRDVVALLQWNLAQVEGLGHGLSRHNAALLDDLAREVFARAVPGSRSPAAAGVEVLGSILRRFYHRRGSLPRGVGLHPGQGLLLSFSSVSPRSGSHRFEAQLVWPQLARCRVMRSGGRSPWAVMA